MNGQPENTERYYVLDQLSAARKAISKSCNSHNLSREKCLNLSQ